LLLSLGAAISSSAEEHDIAVLVSSHRQAVKPELAVPSAARQENVWHSEEATELSAVLAATSNRAVKVRCVVCGQPCWSHSATFDLAACSEDAHRPGRRTRSDERYHQLWQQHGFMRAFRAWLDVESRLTLALVDGERR
jgi:exodeoxyribonuclease V beta subunit